MPRLTIMTPEQVLFRYEVAGLVTRALAWLVDALVIAACYVAIVLLFSLMGEALGFILIILGIFIVDFAYFCFFETRYGGQTPGKRLFSLRVISIHGTRISFTDALIRSLLRSIDLLPWMMVVGGIVAFFDRYHRRLGDIAADTVVIRHARRVMPQSLATQKSRENTFERDRTLRQRILTRISRDERDLVLDLALRRDQLDTAVREQIFADAAAHFRQRLALPDNTEHLSDEQTVINLALLVQEAKFTA